MFLYFLFALFSGTLAADPCNDYTFYSGSTAHKGLSDSTSWNRTSNTACNMHTTEGRMLNSTCGRCDAKILDEGIWYRFDGPWTKIVEVTSQKFCDDFNKDTDMVDVCNAASQFLLVSNGTDGFYHMISTRYTLDTCFNFEEAAIVERKDCKNYYIYKFPELKEYEKGLCEVNGDSWKTGFCMEDNVTTSSLLSDHHFAEPNTMITITAEQSPAPLPGPVTCRESGGDNVPLTPSDNNNHTHHEYTFLLGNDNTTCTINDSDNKQVSAYPVSFQVEDMEGTGGVEIAVVCRVTLATDSTGIIAFIREGKTHHTDIKDYTEEISTHRLELHLTADEAKVPSGARKLVNTYNCGVKDSTEEIISQPFTLTLSKVCSPGLGFVHEGDTECAPCPVHTFSEDSTCINCPDGTDSITEGATSCTKHKPDDPKVTNKVIIIVVVMVTVVLVVGIGVFVAIKLSQRRTRYEMTGGATRNPTAGEPRFTRSPKGDTVE